MAQLNAVARQVTLKNGTVLNLKPLNPLVLERFRTYNKGRPEPPIQEVKYADGSVAKEPNPNDPEYLAALASWDYERGLRITNYILVEGVSDVPPQEFIDEYSEYFPESTAKEMKYLWVSSLVVDQEELTELIAYIVGQTVPTKGGLEEAANTFQGDGK